MLRLVCVRALLNLSNKNVYTNLKCMLKCIIHWHSNQLYNRNIKCVLLVLYLSDLRTVHKPVFALYREILLLILCVFGHDDKW